jgi:hypothetical protein
VSWFDFFGEVPPFTSGVALRRFAASQHLLRDEMLAKSGPSCFGLLIASTARVLSLEAISNTEIVISLDAWLRCL